MHFSAFLVALVATSSTVLAIPRAHKRQALNLNQGSDRLVVKEANGNFVVDDIRFATESVALQVACALDERDCRAGGGNSAACFQQKVSCQSGNGLNGLSELLNLERP